jgi:hypothetical protein
VPISGAWTFQSLIFIPDSLAGDECGTGIALSVSTAFIGCPKDDDQGTDTGTNNNIYFTCYCYIDTFLCIIIGSIYEYRLNQGYWSYQSKLMAPVGIPGDLFGTGVGIYRDMAIIGASYNDDFGSNSGVAYVYQRAYDKWSFLERLYSPEINKTLTVFDFFGSSISVFEGNAIMSAIGDDDQGSGSGI